MKFLVTCGGGFQGQTVLEDLESSRREEDYIFVTNNSTNHLNHALCDETIISQMFPMLVSILNLLKTQSIGLK